MSVEVIQADYANPQHAADIVQMLDQYALDPMGGGKAIGDEVKTKLIDCLQQVPGAFSILAYVDGNVSGFANCFMGFSTFKCKPLVNVHDLAVVAQSRGLGLSQKILHKIEDIALQRGACKITLEVLSNNDVAKNAYLKHGFSSYELDKTKGHALFWEKALG